MPEVDKESYKEKPSLKESVEAIGELCPILKSKDGTIIDGFHRHEIDPNWRVDTRYNIDTPEKILIARLAVNDVRRVMPYEEKKRIFNDLAEIESNKKDIKGSIAIRIEKLTGYTAHTIRCYLESKYKQIQGEPEKVDALSTFEPLDNSESISPFVARLGSETENISDKIINSLFDLNMVDDGDFSRIQKKDKVLKSCLEFKPKFDNWIQLLQGEAYVDNR